MAVKSRGRYFVTIFNYRIAGEQSLRQTSIIIRIAINQRSMGLKFNDIHFRKFLAILFFAISITVFYLPVRFQWPYAGRISAFIFAGIWALMGLRIAYMVFNRKK
jgi:hypothetical protein